MAQAHKNQCRSLSTFTVQLPQPFIFSSDADSISNWSHWTPKLWLSCNSRRPVWYSGPRSNIKILSYHYWEFHCGDKTVVRSSYLHIGISYPGMMASLYWFSPQMSKCTSLMHPPCMSIICSSLHNLVTVKPFSFHVLLTKWYRCMATFRHNM